MLRSRSSPVSVTSSIHIEGQIQNQGPVENPFGTDNEEVEPEMTREGRDIISSNGRHCRVGLVGIMCLLAWAATKLKGKEQSPHLWPRTENNLRCPIMLYRRSFRPGLDRGSSYGKKYRLSIDECLATAAYSSMGMMAIKVQGRSRSCGTGRILRSRAAQLHEKENSHRFIFKTKPSVNNARAQPHSRYV